MTDVDVQHISNDTQEPDLADETIALVRHWLTESAKVPADRAATHLAGVLKDPEGLAFTVGFVDGVIRPEDPRVAARRFAELARDVPRFLPWHLRAAVQVGGAAGLVAPGLVIPLVRRALRSMVGHLIVDATDAKLGRAIAKIRKPGVRLNVNLLGEAVLGNKEADRRLRGTHELLARDDVDYVSIKVSSTVAPHSAWAFDEAVTHVVESLSPLFERAVAAPTPKFINLDMEEYRDLDMTVAAFTTILDKPQFLELEAGIVLQAYLPDALGTMIGLQEWSAARRARGGARVKVRVVKGANLPMERVDAALHDWPLATWGSKRETDTHYKRIIDYALQPERIKNVSLGVAATIFSISPTRGCSRVVVAYATGWRSRCCWAWRRSRPKLSARTSAAFCSTHPSCTHASSTSRSHTWSVGSRKARAMTTSCRPCSTCTTTRNCSSVRSKGSSTRSPRSTRQSLHHGELRTVCCRPCRTEQPSSGTHRTPTPPSHPTDAGDARSWPRRRRRP